MTKRTVVLVQLAVTVAMLALLFVGNARGVSASLHQPMRVGDNGQRVKDLQWLLAGHKPSVYRKTIRTYHGRIDGRYGPMTQRAVSSMKWRLGYPMKDVNGRTGRQLFEFLKGKRGRPLGWIGRASSRAGRPGGFVQVSTRHLACSRRITALARSQIGVREVPFGSNDGTRVRVYQRVTGAFRSPWCASFVQWLMKSTVGRTIANSSAGVFYIVNWAHQRALVHALPRVGALVAYLHNLGHIGIVDRTTPTGFYAIEGNHNNSVQRVWHRTGDHRTVFIYAGCQS